MRKIALFPFLLCALSPFYLIMAQSLSLPHITSIEYMATPILESKNLYILESNYNRPYRRIILCVPRAYVVLREHCSIFGICLNTLPNEEYSVEQELYIWSVLNKADFHTDIYANRLPKSVHTILRSQDEELLLPLVRE